MPFTKNDYAKIRWRCHRGMLELDLILLKYFDDHFDTLTATEQAVFVKLLECPDPELFAWCMGHETPKDKDILNIVQHIRTHV